MHAQSKSYAQLFVTLLTVDRQALLSMEFSRQEYWSSLPFPSPELQMCAEWQKKKKKKVSHLMRTFSAKVKQGDALPYFNLFRLSHRDDQKMESAVC